MANIVKLKRSSVTGKAPVAGDLEIGEPAVNLADRILYTKDAGNTIIVIGSGYTSNIIEGTNLYFSNARVVSAISSQTLTNATFSSDVVSNGVIKSLASGGDEGGEFQLAIPATNTSLNGPIAIDVYQNKLRIFETTGTNRGVYIDLSAANAGVGTNLVGSGGGGGAVSSVNGQTGAVLLTTANIAESGNLYFTNARVYSNVVSIGYATNANVALKANVADLTTSNVSEGTNLYFTNARSRQALTAGTGVSYDSGTGIISIGQNVDTHSSVTFGNVTVTGNLTVQGNAVIFESNTLIINDPLIQVGRNPAGDSVDLGFFGHYIGGSPSIERHAGLFRDASDGQFKLFTNLDPEPVTIVDTSNTSYQSANLVVNYVVGKVTDISNHSTTNLSEGNNLYYTDSRVYSNVTQLGYITASSLSGYATNSQLATYATNSQLGLYATNAQLSAYALDTDLTTANVSELTNLYYTNARVYSNVILLNYITASSLSGYATNAQLATYATNSQLGLYATNAQLTTYALTNSLTTANVTELTNLYFTNARSYANTLVAIKTGNGIIYSNTTGNITLSPTGVTASTYGGAAVQPVIVVDAFGRITSVSNVTSTVANTNITGNIISSQITSVANTQITGNIISSQITSVANSQITGNIISSKLEPTAVTASTYGGAAVQTIITVDQQGRITSASNVTSTVANTNITGNIISSQITSVANTQISGNIISSQITSVANSQITGNTISSKLEPTGVTASTYGGAAVQPVIVIDQQGRITSASNVTSTVANTNITGNIISSQITSVANSQISGNIISSQITSVANSQITGNTISSKLEPTGVTAGVYGSATIIPVITVDQQGRITNVSNASVTGVSSGTSNAVSNTQIIAADGTSTNYNLAGYPSTSNTLIFVDGLLQYSPVHYSFSSNTISFVTAPSNGEQIYIVTLAPGTGGGGGASVTISDSVPSASTAGTFWFDSLYLDLYVSYDNTWVMVGGSGAASAGDQLSALLLPGM